MPDGPMKPAVRSPDDAMRLVEQLSRIFDAPDLYPAQLDEEHGSLAFVPVERADYNALAFHAAAWLREMTPDATLLPMSWLLGHLPAHEPASSAARLVLHHCFSGSTLLSRAIEAVTPTLAVREPSVLHTLATRLAMPTLDADTRACLDDTLTVAMRLLARHYPDQAAAVIKASDAPNLILDRLFLDDPRRRGVFVHTDLATHIAVSVKHEDRRKWVEGRRRWFEDGRFRLPQGTREPLAGVFESAGRIAAAMFVLHLDAYRRVFDAHGPSRLAAVHLESFLGDPVGVSRRVAAHLDLPLVADPEARLAPVLGEHAKSGETYDRAARTEELDAARAEHADEIEDAVAWAERAFPPAALAPPPGSLCADRP